MITVFSSSRRIKYTAAVISAASIFHLVTILLALILPYLIIFNSEELQENVHSIETKPSFKFYYAYAIMLYGPSTDQYYFWSSINTWNQQIRSRVPIIQVQEINSDKDEQLDRLSFVAAFPMETTERVLSAKLWLLFQLNLRSPCSQSANVLLIAEHNSFQSACEWSIAGDLKAVQNGLFDCSSSKPENDLDATLVDPVSQLLLSGLTNYTAKNHTLLADVHPQVTSWLSGDAGRLGQFQVNVRLNYATDTYRFKQNAWDRLIRFWVYYVAFLIALLFLFKLLRKFVFANQLLSTLTRLDGRTYSGLQ